jgi:hypothetical protein
MCKLDNEDKLATQDIQIDNRPTGSSSSQPMPERQISCIRIRTNNTTGKISPRGSKIEEISLKTLLFVC